MNPIVSRFDELGVFKGSPHGVNHCLINEYLPGQGIMPHEDGAAYYPVVATVSLGSSLVLTVTNKPHGSEDPSPGIERSEQRRSWRILQEPRSLLVTSGAAYTDTLHGIADVTEDSDLNATTIANWTLLGDNTRQKIVDNGGHSTRTKRISLTYRDVKKVSAVGSKIFGRPKT